MHDLRLGYVFSAAGMPRRGRIEELEGPGIGWSGEQDREITLTELESGAGFIGGSMRVNRRYCGPAMLLSRQCHLNDPEQSCG